MTEIFVAVPLMTIPDQLHSPSIVHIQSYVKGEKFCIENPSIFESEKCLLDTICIQGPIISKYQ